MIDRHDSWRAIWQVGAFTLALAARCGSTDEFGNDYGVASSELRADSGLCANGLSASGLSANGL